MAHQHHSHLYVGASTWRAKVSENFPRGQKSRKIRELGNSNELGERERESARDRGKKWPMVGASNKCN